MPKEINIVLVMGACLSAVAALLHIGIIFGGGPWYRFFGAGEHMAQAAEAGKLFPALITVGIALVLAAWGAYALSGAGVIQKLPFLKPALLVITAIYLLRGLAVVSFVIFARDSATPFILWSSGICMLYGAVHGFGLAQVWTKL